MAKRYLGGGISFEQKDVYQEFSEEESPSPGGSSTLAGLTDVDLTNPTDGQILVYDAETQKWVNGNGSGGSSTLAGLTDVDISNPSDGQTLVYNATSGKWENGESAGGGGSLLVTLTMTENQQEKGGAKGGGTDTYTITADKTAGEIQTALKTGICVIYTFADSVDDREYTGCMGPVVYTHDGYHDGYYVYWPNGPVEGLFAATANDYPINDRYNP